MWKSTMCVAYGCNNRRSNTSFEQRLTFHVFPKDESLREKWVQAIRRENWKPKKYSILCSEHFTEDSFDRSSPFVTILKKGSVPTIFPAFPPHLQNKEPKERRILKRTIIQEEAEIPGKIQAVEADLRKKSLKLMQAKKNLRNMKLKMRRMTKKVVNLKNMIKLLNEKFCIQNEYCDILKNISKTSFCLIRREAQKKVSPKNTQVYDKRLRNFATTLHFLSPKAYDYVRKTFQTCLPHPKTLSKWYQTINAQPGFCREVFEALKKKCNEGEAIVGSLIFDAMAIRSHVDWDGKKLFGYVDLGQGTTDDSAPLAKEVFVIHFVCVNSLWKIPLGYFFINGLNSEQISSLLLQCLNMLSNINITVSSITCDGTSSNFAAAIKLGCSFKNHEQIQSTFKYNNHIIHFYFDPSHMLKLIRNTLHDLKVIIDPKGRRVCWIYLEKLHNIQKIDSLTLGNKITHQHIYFHNQKMKVKLAAQLLSRSVADSLRYCISKKIDGFEDAQATVEFIEIMNDLFDILNSRNIMDKHLKKPINESNEQEIFELAKKAKLYLVQLKDVNGKNILLGNRKTVFLGFLVCLNSMQDMYKRLVKEEKLLKYLPMYKTSQDHLERLFGYIRSRGGTNNNPSAFQFYHTFKRIIVHKQLHEGASTSGNAIPLDSINFLGVSFHQQMENPEMSPENIINISVTNCMNAEEIPDTDPELENEIEDVYLNETVTDIVQYISGFVAKSLAKKIKCKQCTDVLFGDPIAGGLIGIKNRGGLAHPSHDIVRICKICEQVFRNLMLQNLFPRKNLDIILSTRAIMIVQGMNFFINSVHMKELSEENHEYMLIETIIKYYFNIRIYKYVKDQNEEISKSKIRQKFNKLVLFKGQ